MGNHEKKSENEVKVNALIVIGELRGAIDALNERVIALEKAMIEVKHLNTDDGSRHRNDGGWFD